jgi:hypothetical protein
VVPLLYSIKMRLAAIYNTWSDWDFLRLSIEHHRSVFDNIILVASEKSNYGVTDPEFKAQWSLGIAGISHFQYEPDLKKPASENETAKRNYGLNIARKSGCTHFICLDADEFYNLDEFNAEKEKFKFNHNLAGMVCRIQTYFGSPELTIGDEGTLGPFIHRITPGLKHEFNRRYPFAWSGGLRNRRLHIDPTRSLNIYDGVEMSGITMHHYSWVRKDFQKKIRNSTARTNLENSSILNDLALAKEDQMCNFYGKVLRRVPNYFGIPDYGVEIQTTDASK